MNNDTFADVIVGAPTHDNGATNTLEGAAYVYHGGSGGVATTAATTLASTESNAYFGTSVAGAGDVNGDSYADVIVGAPFHANGILTNAGAAYVFHGSAGVTMTANAPLEGDQAGAYFGWSVAGAGDVNGDSYADVIVGAPYHSNGTLTNAGAAFVYYGSDSAGVDTTVDAQLLKDQAGAFFGDSVAGAGDVNNDGFADVIVGAQGFDHGQTDEGAAFVYLGSTTYYTVTASAGANGSLDTAVQASPYTVVPGDTISFEFVADPGYRIASVAGCGISYTNNLAAITTYTAATDPATADCTVTATFSNTHTVAATAGANGSLDTAYRTSPQTVVYGDTTSFKFNAAAGYHVAGVSGCGIDYNNSLFTVTTYIATTSTVTGDCSVEATFSNANNSPTLGSVTPDVRTSAPNVAQSLSAVYSDADGYADLARADLLINTTASATNGIYATYNRSTGKITLFNNAGTGSDRQLHPRGGGHAVQHPGVDQLRHHDCGRRWKRPDYHLEHHADQRLRLLRQEEHLPLYAGQRRCLDRLGGQGGLDDLLEHRTDSRDADPVGSDQRSGGATDHHRDLQGRQRLRGPEPGGPADQRDRQRRERHLRLL